MDNVLVARLSRGATLGEEDRASLRGLERESRIVPARTDLGRQGERAETINLVLDGVSCHYRVTDGGARSIMSLILPGDFCDPQAFLMARRDHFVATLSKCLVVSVSPSRLEMLIATRPRIQRALWWSTLVDKSVLREWVVNVGRRRSDHQLAHLFCEWHARLVAVGRARDGSFAQPLTMDDLADVLGRSAVHTQRTLQVLREAGLVVAHDRRLTIPDVARLRLYAGFDPTYLHLDGAAAEMEPSDMSKTARRGTA